MAMLDDHFAEIFVGSCNAFLAVGVTGIRVFSGEFESNSYFGFLTGQELQEITSFQRALFVK